jgi:2-amino-4-hydroxy-6-hydroxymethyldihydropteridine diphosphokinase
MARAFLSLGSNISPRTYLPHALEQIRAFGTVVKVSGTWVSPPADGSEQADFCNCALLLETDLTPERIWDELIPAVEGACGRERDPSNPYAPRTCDVDLTIYDTVELEYKRHRIPDPDLFERAFVAVPLAELDPDFVVPGDGRTLAAIAESLQGKPELQPRTDIELPVDPPASE